MRCLADLLLSVLPNIFRSFLRLVDRVLISLGVLTRLRLIRAAGLYLESSRSLGGVPVTWGLKISKLAVHGITRQL